MMQNIFKYDIHQVKNILRMKFRSEIFLVQKTMESPDLPIALSPIHLIIFQYLASS